MENSATINNNEITATYVPTVTIPLERYNELLRKEVIFDIEKQETEANAYATTSDKIKYGIKDRGVE